MIEIKYRVREHLNKFTIEISDTKYYLFGLIVKEKWVEVNRRGTIYHIWFPWSYPCESFKTLKEAHAKIKKFKHQNKENSRPSTYHNEL